MSKQAIRGRPSKRQQKREKKRRLKRKQLDESYFALVVRPSQFFAKFLYWADQHIIDWLVNFAGRVGRFVANIDGAIDKYLVDEAVNLVANATIEGGRALRRVQTGRIQTYLYGALGGALAVVLLNFLIK